MTDRELLARPEDLALLRAVAAGRVVRGEHGGETSVFSAHYFDGTLVRMELRRLVAQELINMPISGSPTLAPRGWRLLLTANGEQAAEIDPP